MPLIPSAATVLPDIDSAPSTSALAAADALIQSELSSQETTSLHPLIPNYPEPKFSDLIETEHARLSSGTKDSNASGIDLTRYEALDAPNPTGEGADAAREEWKATLRKAYTSAEYLRAREENLGLLETFGKNAWLISNSQLEGLLGGLERDVEGVRAELEAVEQARRAGLGNAEGELKGLEEGWRKGVGRLIETLAAAEGLRLEALERRRRGVGGVSG